MIYELGLKNGEKGRFEHEDIAQLLSDIEGERRVSDTWIVVGMERDGAIRKAYVNVDEISYIVELEGEAREQSEEPLDNRMWRSIPAMSSRL